jgi:hypothetical protein
MTVSKSMKTPGLSYAFRLPALNKWGKHRFVQIVILL